MYHCYQEQPCLYDNTKVFQAERFFFLWLWSRHVYDPTNKKKTSDLIYDLKDDFGRFTAGDT